MFCWQCERNSGSTCRQPRQDFSQAGCLSNLLLATLKGLGAIAELSRSISKTDRLADRFLTLALYATLTNVNVDVLSLASLIDLAVDHQRRLLWELPQTILLSTLPPRALLEPGPTLADKLALGSKHYPNKLEPINIVFLRQTALYGLKGLAAYVYHAAKLGYEDDSLYAFVEHILARSLDSSLTEAAWLDLALLVGEKNLTAMELLDKAQALSFQAPEPTKVKLGTTKGPAVAINGHDLRDLAQLLTQAKKMGVNVYTHGEMLSAHAYADLSHHLAGHYGTGWPYHSQELNDFPGPIIFTANCFSKPDSGYLERSFTVGPVAWPGVRHLEPSAAGQLDFSPALSLALALGGFAEDQDGETVEANWNWSAIFRAKDIILSQVREDLIQLLSSEDDNEWPQSGSSQELARTGLAPIDTVLLTLTCGKSRLYEPKIAQVLSLPTVPRPTRTGKSSGRG
ncbi:MAG: hypothetical protein LBR11_10120 [Deltaproteobacteria bacterium]|jgi:hydroxylamine reductase|nr:hypothetical protein [Deltaproteobacteria bacterium]